MDDSNPLRTADITFTVEIVGCLIASGLLYKNRGFYNKEIDKII